MVLVVGREMDAAKDRAKEKLGDVREKAEDFVRDKTDGKGIFGFGKDK